MIEISTLSEKHSGNIQLINNSDKSSGNTLQSSSQATEKNQKSIVSELYLTMILKRKERVIINFLIIIQGKEMKKRLQQKVVAFLLASILTLSNIFSLPVAVYAENVEDIDIEEVLTSPDTIEEFYEEDADESSVCENEVVEEEQEYPSQNFGSKSLNAVTVEASCDEGVFPEGTEMKLSSVSSLVKEEIMKAVNSQNGENEKTVDIVAVDITFFHDGEEIQPKGKVNVSMHSDRAIEGDNHKVVHYDGDTEIIADASGTDASITADSFSIYAIVGEDYTEQVEKTVRYFYDFYVDENLVETQIVKTGDKLTEPSIPDSETNKEFAGWRAEGTTEDLNFDERITTDAADTEDKHIRVDARFVKKYQVIFYMNEEKSLVLDTIVKPDGESVDTTSLILANTDTKQFKGWYDAATGTKTNVDSVTLNGKDIELLPIFEEGVWVRFHSMGGTYVKPVFKYVNDTVASPLAERMGYTLTGWYTSEASAEANVEADKFDFSTPVTDTIDLYAGWEAQKVKYQLAIWTENADDDEYALYGVEEKEEFTGTELTAAMFEAIEPLENGQYPCFDLDVDKTSENLCTVKGDGTTVQNVYFKRHVFTVGFYNASGSLIFTIPNVKYNSCMYDSYKPLYEQYQDQLPGTGWRRDYRNDQYVMLDAEFYEYKKACRYIYLDQKTEAFYRQYIEPHKDNTGILKLTRQNREVYTYTFNTYYQYLDDETTPEGAEIKEVDGVTYYKYQEAKSFRVSNTWGNNYWNTRPWIFTKAVNVATGQTLQMTTGSDSNTVQENANTLYDHFFRRGSYQLGFDEPGLESSDLLFEEKLTGYEPKNYVKGETEKMIGEKTYVFKGWETKDGELVDFSTARMPQEDLVLYAKWEPVYRNVTVNYDNGDEATSITVEEGDTVTSIVTPVKDGYTFVGWRTSEGDIFDFDTKIVNDTELIAIWQPQETAYTVHYDAGEFGNFDKQDANRYVNEATAVILGAPTVTNSKKIFIGWKIGDDSLMKSGTFQIKKSDADNDNVITLMAQYSDKPDRTTVTYDPNGGNGTVKTYEDVAENNEETTVKDADAVGFRAKTGYKFKHWSTSADDSGDAFYPKEKIFLDTNDSNKTLYAVWEKDESQTKTLKYTVQHEVAGEVRDSDVYTLDVWVLDEDKIEVIAGSLDKKIYEGYKYESMDSEVAVGDEVDNGAIITLKYVAQDDKLVYDSNGGTGDMADTPGKTFDTVTVSTHTFTRSDYEFAGWNTKADGTGITYTDGADYVLTTEDDVLYAQWTKIEESSQQDDGDTDTDTPADDKDTETSANKTSPKPVTSAPHTGDDISLAIVAFLFAIATLGGFIFTRIKKNL